MRMHDRRNMWLESMREARERAEEADRARRNPPVITWQEALSFVALLSCLAAAALWY